MNIAWLGKVARSEESHSREHSKWVEDGLAVCGRLAKRVGRLSE